MGKQSEQPCLRLVSWNMNHSPKAWTFLLSSDPLPDVALLQEALKPKKVPYWSTPTADEPWQIHGYVMKFCTAVVGLSDRVKGRPLATRRIGETGEHELPVSLPGTIALAEISIASGETVTVISTYSTWEYSFSKSQQTFADASAHRIISDISALSCSPKGHHLIVAGDWNIFHGYGDDGSDYWKARYQTVFSRMEALGLMFVGPQYPGGILADSNPGYFPSDSKNVPTLRKRGAGKPATARDQLDFVFASSSLCDRLRVKALNTAEEWGPSDHCRITIDLW